MPPKAKSPPKSSSESETTFAPAPESLDSLDLNGVFSAPDLDSQLSTSDTTKAVNAAMAPGAVGIQNRTQFSSSGPPSGSLSDDLLDRVFNASYTLLDLRGGRWSFMLFGAEGGAEFASFDTLELGQQFLSDNNITNCRIPALGIG